MQQSVYEYKQFILQHTLVAVFLFSAFHPIYFVLALLFLYSSPSVFSRDSYRMVRIRGSHIRRSSPPPDIVTAYQVLQHFY